MSGAAVLSPAPTHMFSLSSHLLTPPLKSPTAANDCHQSEWACQAYTHSILIHCKRHANDFFPSMFVKRQGGPASRMHQLVPHVISWDHQARSLFDVQLCCTACVHFHHLLSELTKKTIINQLRILIDLLWLMGEDVAADKVRKSVYERL